MYLGKQTNKNSTAIKLETVERNQKIKIRGVIIKPQSSGPCKTNGYIYMDIYIYLQS